VSFPLWVALRYLRAHRHSGFVTLLAGISVAGVAVGVTALLTVLAVMNGFENEIQTRIAGTDAHLVVTGEGVAGIAEPEPLLKKVLEDPGVSGAAPFTYAKAMVLHGKQAEGLVVKGVDLAGERGVTTIAEHIHPEMDSIPLATTDGSPGIVLGAELAARLGVGVGDVVLLASLAGGAQLGAAVMPKLRPFTVVGTFASGLYTYDSAFGFLAIPAAQSFFELGSATTGVQAKLRDMNAAPRVAERLRRNLGPGPWRVNHWIEMNRNLFSWMRLEKTAMFVILALIVLVAAFNIVSTLFMVVLEKRRDIGVLKSMGATSTVVMRIFLIEGLLIGAAGTALGTALGSSLIAILRRYPLITLPGDVYFIERLPVRPEGLDFVAVIGAALVLCLLAAFYPAWRASRLDPVEAIRRQV
jgi:lipoprotein-releasing system permease protein